MTPNEFLLAWISKKGISKSQCDRDCGYFSNVVTNTLSPNNPRKVTYDLIGRLLMAYGKNGPALPMLELMKNGEGNGHV